jgi:hypothetical protein
VGTKLPGQPKPENLPASPSFEELAALQGVEPVREFDELLGVPYADDESTEEFSRLLRSWRSEGGPAASQR